jgi:hypothetical protein
MHLKQPRSNPKKTTVAAGLIWKMLNFSLTLQKH